MNINNYSHPLYVIILSISPFCSTQASQPARPLGKPPTGIEHNLTDKYPYLNAQEIKDIEECAKVAHSIIINTDATKMPDVKRIAINMQSLNIRYITRMQQLKNKEKFFQKESPYLTEDDEGNCHGDDIDVQLDQEHRAIDLLKMNIQYFNSLFHPNVHEFKNTNTCEII
ncbi:MAG: hypothetical protein P4L31_06630 [Candidatus Babeliales bacterium]|nr:hypothetical protein [Candidatus Babeliales bacterium]